MNVYAACCSVIVAMFGQTHTSNEPGDHLVVTLPPSRSERTVEATFKGNTYRNIFKWAIYSRSPLEIAIKSGEAVELDEGTTVQLIRVARGDPDLAQVKIVSGKYRGKVLFVIDSLLVNKDKQSIPAFEPTNPHPAVEKLPYAPEGVELETRYVRYCNDYTGSKMIVVSEQGYWRREGGELFKQEWIRVRPGPSPKAEPTFQVETHQPSLPEMPPDAEIAEAIRAAKSVSATVDVSLRRRVFARERDKRLSALATKYKVSNSDLSAHIRSSGLDR